MRKGLNGLHKTLIAFAPVAIGYGLIFGTRFPNPVSVNISLLLLVIGTILAVTFAIQGTLKSNPKAHPIWLILTFFAVGAAYIAISFGGCILVGTMLGK